MSFTTSIYGNAPANTFVYTTTTVSVDNISVENLSATNASISVLTTTLFNPINVDATNIDCTNLTVTGDANISHIHVSNISLDGTIGGHTANLVTLNADNAIADELYLNEQSSVLTDKSLIKRDANQVKFIGKSNASDTTGADYVFRTGLETDAAKLTISRTSDIVGAIALAVDTTIEGDTGIFDTLNVSTLNVSNSVDLTTINVSMINASNISCVNLSASNDITALEVRGTVIVSSPILEGGFVDTLTGDITNLSSNNISLSNATITTSLTGAGNINITGDIQTTGVVTGATLTGDIGGNLAAGTGIQLATAAGVTTITNTGVVTDPLNVCQLNASNISCVNLSASKDLSALEIRGTAIVSSPILEGGFVDTLTGDITNLSSTNISLSNATITTSLTGAGNINITGDIQTTGVVTGATLTGDIAGNLAAGTGINLNTVGGITTISNTGGSVTDPLNLSKLNASNISCDNISAALITGDIFSTLSAGGGVTISQNTPSAGITQISATGLSTSTQYAFKAYSTSGDAYSISGATTIPYNSLAPLTGYDGYSIPTTSSYDTAQATYTIPVSGYWYIGYTLRQRTSATTNALVAIYRNSSIYMINGNYTGNQEGMSINLYADVGDLIYVRSISGSFSVDMRPTAAMFFGYLLQPVNNTVSSSTNLSIQNLSVSGDITATSITADLSPNLTAGLNMGLSTTTGNTTINSAQQIYCLSLTNNISPGGAVVGRSILYDTIKYDSGGGLFVLDPLTGETEVTQAGNYCISATGNIFNDNYSDRVNFRIRFRVNGVWVAGYPQAYSYARHQNYARYATSVITDFCLPLDAGDKIDIHCNIAKATNANFTSNFSGLQLFNGATFTIKRI